MSLARSFLDLDVPKTVGTDSGSDAGLFKVFCWKYFAFEIIKVFFLLS